MEGFKWVDSNVNQSIPDSAEWGGEDVDGQPMFVGKAKYNEDWIPAKIIPGRKTASICVGGKEVYVEDYKVLCKRGLEWVSCQGSNIPSNAVLGGETNKGQLIFIGRVRYKNSLTVIREDGVCYIPFQGDELAFKEYDILIMSDD